MSTNRDEGLKRSHIFVGSRITCCQVLCTYQRSDQQKPEYVVVVDTLVRPYPRDKLKRLGKFTVVYKTQNICEDVLMQRVTDFFTQRNIPEYRKIC